MNLNSNLSGRYKIIIVNEDESIAREDDWQKNLITDEGLHCLFKDSGFVLPAEMEYCVVGSGNTANVTDSTLSGTNATCSGTTVTANQAFFNSGMVGRTIKFDSGQTARIASFSSTSVVVIDTAFTIAVPTDFAIWRTNITALDNQLKITNTYVTLNAGCGTYFTGTDSIFHRRTFDFATEVSNQNYSELGIGWYKGPGATNFTLLSRILISGGSVSILTGQRLRIVYELYLRMSSGTYQKTAFSIPITGWTENTGFAQVMGPFTSRINAGTGATDAYTAEAIGDPINTTALLHLSQSTGIFIPFDLLNTQAQPGTMSANTQCTVSLLPYASGSYSRNKAFFWDIGFGNMTGIKTIRSWHGASNTFSSFVAELATSPNSKTSLQQLNLYGRVSINRDLINP